MWFAQAQEFAAHGRLEDAERLGFLAYTQSTGVDRDEIGLFLGPLLLRLDRPENARDVLRAVADSPDQLIAAHARDLLRGLPQVDSTGLPQCSFCDRPSNAVDRLFAGPDPFFMCNVCVELCTEIRENEPDRAPSDLVVTCSFCGSQVTTDRAVLTMYRDDLVLCYDCHDLMVEILQE